MKTRSWLLLFSALTLICAALSLILFAGGTAVSFAEVYSDGKWIRTLDLSINGEYRIEYGEEWNLLTVRDGKVAVTASSCASQDCVHHAPANSGAPIVCLPNRLVIRFSADAALDAVIG